MENRIPSGFKFTGNLLRCGGFAVGLYQALYIHLKQGEDTKSEWSMNDPLFCSLHFVNLFSFATFTAIMRIIAKSTLRSFWEKHNDAENPLRMSHKMVEKQTWNNTHDVKRLFGDASIVGNNRVVFNIKGNDYRLVVYIVFKWQKVFIRFIGTHKQYDRIDVKTV